MHCKEWKEVKLLVITEIVWLIAGLVVMIINAAVAIAVTVIFLIVGGLTLALFILAFLQQEEKINPLLK